MAATSLRIAALLLVSLDVAALSGCHVSTNKHGKNKNVDIGTPFGSMSVKTNDDATNANLGISAYPGAVPVHNDKDENDNGAADVNMSFGNFHMGVMARSYQTSDKPDKVTAFYRKDLAHYGDTIQCEGSNTVGSPARTSEGLTCDEANNNHISVSSHSSSMELRSGSPTRQRIVSIEAKDGGTRIGLVKLDLPSGGHSHGKESE